MLNIKKLTVSVGKKKIIADFNFTFEQGKIYAIMGPNGSGKSTLAYSLMGHPLYLVNNKSKITYKKENLVALKPEKRSELGLFMSFQTPLSLSGVTPYQLLLTAAAGKWDPLQLRNKINAIAKELKVSQELLSRSLNEGASGGEKKKLEVLQAAILDKQVQIFDEIDTGVDVDALKTIAKFLDRHKKGKTYILITHYNRILHYLKPDKVLVLVDGKLVKVGGAKLAEQIEKKGYQLV